MDFPLYLPHLTGFVSFQEDWSRLAGADYAPPCLTGNRITSAPAFSWSR